MYFAVAKIQNVVEIFPENNEIIVFFWKLSWNRVGTELMAGMQVYIIEIHIHLETNLDWYSSNVVNWSLLSSHQIIIRFKIHEIWIIGNLVRNRP